MNHGGAKGKVSPKSVGFVLSDTAVIESGGQTKRQNNIAIPVVLKNVVNVLKCLAQIQFR